MSISILLSQQKLHEPEHPKDNRKNQNVSETLKPKHGIPSEKRGRFAKKLPINESLQILANEKVNTDFI